LYFPHIYLPLYSALITCNLLSAYFLSYSTRYPMLDTYLIFACFLFIYCHSVYFIAYNLLYSYFLSSYIFLYFSQSSFVLSISYNSFSVSSNASSVFFSAFPLRALSNLSCRSFLVSTAIFAVPDINSSRHCLN